MEAKEFHIEVRMQNGALGGVLEERGKIFSSWIGLGPAGLGVVLEGFERSFQVPQEEQWH